MTDNILGVIKDNKCPECGSGKVKHIHHNQMKVIFLNDPDICAGNIKRSVEIEKANRQPRSKGTDTRD